MYARDEVLCLVSYGMVEVSLEKSCVVVVILLLLSVEFIFTFLPYFVFFFHSFPSTFILAFYTFILRASSLLIFLNFYLFIYFFLSFRVYFHLYFRDIFLYSKSYKYKCENFSIYKRICYKELLPVLRMYAVKCIFLYKY